MQKASLSGVLFRCLKIHTFSQQCVTGMSSRHSSRLAYRRSTGNDVSSQYKRHHFLFSHRMSVQNLTGAPKKLGVDTNSDPVGHFGAPSGHFGFCMRWGIAGGERVRSRSAPLGWYFQIVLFLILKVLSLCDDQDNIEYVPSIMQKK